MYIQHSDLVTPTEKINLNSDNISERLKVHATRLKEVEPYTTVKRSEPTMQEKPISNISESVAKQQKRRMNDAGWRAFSTIRAKSAFF